ncbi:aminotransferase [Chromatiales bacterium (ex Bugula neritina AB1)]|nr:aminotransferase [Chromatiales bacterium (ex Bugula neritina AB1)]
MAVGDTIFTYFNGKWEKGNTPIMGAADHGTWLGTLIFDGARKFNGVAPDLDSHCERANESAVAMGLKPTLTTAAMVEIALEGLAHYAADESVYIRPMYWSKESGPSVVGGDPESTEFCMCLENVPMPDTDASMTLGTTRFCRPMLSMQLVNAKAACLYPHNARMLREVNANGFKNAIVCDALGNVAETATSNLMMVRDGEILTPAPNGTFLNGITRKRFTKLLRDEGKVVSETTLSLDDFRNADEIFATGNIAKITPVTRIEDRYLQAGPVARMCRELYWDWAASS